MSADDEIDKTREEIKAAADLIARLRRDRENRRPFDEPDDPDDGGRKAPARQRQTRTVGHRGGHAPRSGVSGPGIG